MSRSCLFFKQRPVHKEEKIGFPNKMFLTEMLLCHQGMEFLDVLLLLETVLIDHRRQYTKDVIICSDND